MEAPAAYNAVSRPIVRQALPTPATSGALGVLGELGRALGDERVALGNEGASSELALDDHLAAVAERVRHHAAVDHGDGLGAVTVADPEAQRIALALDRPVHYLARQLVGLPGTNLARLAGGGGRAEAGVDERAGEQHGGAQEDREPQLALAGGVHRPGC